MKYIVMRTYSHTDKRCLWSAESRYFNDRASADSWCEWLEKEWDMTHKKPQKFFVVAVELPDTVL